MSAVRSLLAAVLTLAAPWAAAQVTLYEHENFSGQAAEFHDAVADLSGSGMNDKASSVVVRSGSWQLCEHSHFGGRCVTLTPGRYPALASMGMNDMVSSLRPTGGHEGGGPPPRPAPPPIAGGPGGRLVLFENTGFNGRSVAIDHAVVSLDDFGINDRAQSAIVYEGNWELCEHGEFRGDCRVYPPGQYSDLGGLARRVSSVRPVPHGGGPVYPPGWGREVRAILYEGSNFSGRQFVVESNQVRNLADTGFNDRASSLRIERGYWLFCSDANYDGECRTFGPGDYPNLPPGLNHRISSGRRIAEYYPYNQPPHWDGPR